MPKMKPYNFKTLLKFLSGLLLLAKLASVSDKHQAMTWNPVRLA